MQNGAKIHLSAQEIELITNKEWLFLKPLVHEKMEDIPWGIIED